MEPPQHCMLKLLWCDDQRTWRGGRLRQNILAGGIVHELKVSMQRSMEYVLSLSPICCLPRPCCMISNRGSCIGDIDPPGAMPILRAALLQGHYRTHCGAFVEQSTLKMLSKVSPVQYSSPVGYITLFSFYRHDVTSGTWISDYM